MNNGAHWEQDHCVVQYGSGLLNAEKDDLIGCGII